MFSQSIKPKPFKETTGRRNFVDHFKIFWSFNRQSPFDDVNHVTTIPDNQIHILAAVLFSKHLPIVKFSINYLFLKLFCKVFKNKRKHKTRRWRQRMWRSISCLVAGQQPDCQQVSFWTRSPGSLRRTLAGRPAATGTETAGTSGWRHPAAADAARWVGAG